MNIQPLPSNKHGHFALIVDGQPWTVEDVNFLNDPHGPFKAMQDKLTIELAKIVKPEECCGGNCGCHNVTFEYDESKRKTP